MRQSLLSLLFVLGLAALAGACSDDDTNPPLDQGVTKQDGTAADKGTGMEASTPDAAPDAATADSATPDTGSTTPDQSAQSCTTCHGFPPSTGKHSKHVSKGLGCSTCHSGTVDSSNKIISTTLHKNGTKDVKGSFTWNASSKSCSSVGCHGTKSW